MTRERDNIRVHDHITITDRGDDRKDTDSGIDLYSNNGELRAVDDDGTIAVPFRRLNLTPIDVTAISSPEQGWVAYNDGTTGTEGPAFYDGSSWTSMADGTSI
jgi:hypothetical protein